MYRTFYALVIFLLCSLSIAYAAKESSAASDDSLKAAPISVTKVEDTTSEFRRGFVLIETFGGWTFSQGNFDAMANSEPAAVGNDTKITKASQNANGFGGGAFLGYGLADNFSVVLGTAVRYTSGRKFSNENGGGTWTQQSANLTVGLMLGLRPYVEIWGGRFFVGAGWLAILPFREITEFTNSSNGANFTAAGDSLKYTDTYNFTVKGMYGEMGIQYDITDMVYINLAARAFVAGTNNIDQTRVEVRNIGGNMTKTTTTYRESASQDDIDAEQNSSASATNQKDLSRDWRNKGITDISIQLGVGVHF